MDRLNKLISKAEEQLNQKYHWTRRDEEQQQQQQYGQQQYGQYSQPQQQQQQQPQQQYGQYGQQTYYSQSPPPPPPYTPLSSASTSSPATQQNFTPYPSQYQAQYQQPYSQVYSQGQPDLAQIQQQANAAAAQAQAQLEAGRREAERLAAEMREKMERDRQEAARLASQMKIQMEAQQREAEKLVNEQKIRLEAEQREAERLADREKRILEAEQREAERWANREKLRVEAAQREAERLANRERAQMEEAQREAEKKERRIQIQMEAAQREVEKRESEMRIRVEEQQRESERLASERQRQIEARQREAERVASLAQEEADRQQVERLAAQYQREYEREQEEMERKMGMLNVGGGVDRETAMPPRPLSAVPSTSPSHQQQYASYPPPPPVLSPGVAVGAGLVPPVSSSGQQGPHRYGNYQPPSVEAESESPALSTGTYGQQPQQPYFPLPPTQAAQSPLPPRPMSAAPPVSSTGTPGVQVQGSATPNIPQQYANYPPPPPPSSSPAELEAAPSMTNPSGQQQQPYFAPPPTQSTSSTHPPMPPRVELPVPPPQPASFQPPPQPEQPRSSPAASVPPRYRTPPPQKPHPCGTTPVTECIEDPVTFESDWFTHAAAPSFLVCSKCYVDHIYNSQLKDAFRLTHFNDKQPRKCHFGSKRMKDSLWPAAITSGTFAEAIEFMKKRQDIPNCPMAAVKTDESWYTTPDIPGATFCKACYEEDDLAATPFGSKFTLETSPNQCYCDSSTVYIKRMFKTHSPTNSWSTFVTEVKARFQFPACEKTNPASTVKRPWFEATKGPKGLVICGACYYDFFHRTEDQDSFVQAFTVVDHEKFAATCVLGCLNLWVPASQAIAKEDRALFWTALQNVDDNAFCNPQGTKGASWYTLPNNPPEFGICGGCYAGIVQVLGGTKYFVPRQGVSKDESLLCCFNIGNPRFAAYLQKYTESLLKGTSQPLDAFATRFSSVPLCPKSNMNLGNDRKWWGWDGADICEDCYLTFAEGTALEAQFTFRGELDPKTHICTLYSPRMRKLYLEACTSGDLKSYLEFANHRFQVFLQTVPQMERMLNQAKITAMQAQNAGMMGSFYKHLGGTLDATIGHSYTVGNAAVGYGYANEYMLDGAMYDRQASQLGAAATSPMAMYNIEVLENRWKTVE